MIEPTDADIGRRVRWIGHTFGTLRGIEGDDALVAFEDDRTHEVFIMALIALTDLNWADSVGVVFRAGDQEPDPAFPRLKRVHHVS